MAYTTKSAGQSLRASLVNAYLKQGIPPFADTTARDAAIASPDDGQHAYLTGSDTLTQYQSSAWVVINEPKQTWTPVVSQPGTITHTKNWGWYQRQGGLYRADCKLTITGTGTGGNAITVSTPFTHVDAGGIFRIFDDSLGAYRVGGIQPQTTDLYSFVIDEGAAEYGVAGSDGLTADDVIWLTVQGSY